MNIKLRINEVINLLPQIAAEQLHKTLSPIAQTVGVMLPPVKIGHGYYLWTLDGDNWESFTKLDTTQKAIIAELYQDKIDALNKHLAGSPLRDKVITIPSEDFIFMRPNGSSYDIALTGWGYKYPNGQYFATFWLRDSVATDFAGFYGYYGTHMLTVGSGKTGSNEADLKSAIRPACYIDIRYITEAVGTGSFEDKTSVKSLIFISSNFIIISPKSML